MTTKEIVIRNINTLCTLHHLSLRELGRRLSYSKTKMWARQSGGAEWKLEELDEVSRLFGVPVSRLVAPDGIITAPVIDLLSADYKKTR